MSKKSQFIALAIAVVIIVGVGAFYGGTIYEKSSLSKQGLLRGGNNQFGGNRQSGQGGQGGPGRQFGGTRGGGPNGENNAFAAGEILSKDDKSINIKDRDGSTKIIYFSDTTTVGKTVSGSASDLNTGEQVMVNGKNNSDGSLTAQNIQIRPAEGEARP